MSPGDTLRFSYSAFLQKAEVVFTAKKNSDTGVGISCRADVKLPMLKKSFQTSTTYKNHDLSSWLEHIPLCELNTPSPGICMSNDDSFQGAIDPVTFFMKLHQKSWEGDSVRLIIGRRVAQLQVKKIFDGYDVSRPEKDQRLIARLDNNGISKIEIPVPVIGTLSLVRK